MVYVVILCLIIIGILIYKLYQKQEIDRFNLEDYKQAEREAKDAWQKALIQRNDALSEYKDIKQKCEYEEYKLEECKKDIQAALDTYNNLTENKLKEIDVSLENQRQRRQEELDQTFEETKQKYDLMVQDKIKESEEELNALLIASNEEKRKMDEETEMYQREVAYWERTWLSILEPIKRYEKTKQERLFYTIQVPEEYHEDIEFLLTTVAAKVQHPDIISKLVWAEYVKPYLDDTFKRIEIKAEPGIYKLTNINNNKSYVGKSTNVKTRIADHFKSSVGIKSIADQAVHHAILKDGFWNWQIEVLTYCDKDELSEREKYYIGFFKTQEYGYNKTGGG